jgi:hypothetical protein
MATFGQTTATDVSEEHNASVLYIKYVATTHFRVFSKSRQYCVITQDVILQKHTVASP